MVNEDILTQFSINLASAVFPDTSRGRSLSQMTADTFNTNTRTVHVVGLAILAGIALANSRD